MSAAIFEFYAQVHLHCTVVFWVVTLLKLCLGDIWIELLAVTAAISLYVVADLCSSYCSWWVEALSV